MCRPAAESQDAEAAKLAPWLEVAEKLGARHLRVFGGPVPKDATEDQGVAWIVETLKKCAGLAGQRGMTLGVEDDDPLTIKSERLVEIVKRVNSPWVGINLDVGNFRAEAYRQIEVCLPYAVNVHLKSEVTEEGRRVPTDWDRLLKLFAPVYRGYLALEYEGRPDAPTAVPELIRKLQHILPKYAPGA
jgi:sugar phosphate isomerase/epimerase